MIDAVPRLLLRPVVAEAGGQQMVGEKPQAMFEITHAAALEVCGQLMGHRNTSVR